uniref:UBL3-like ubiquitin domain-containing protein n=1 Tax=Leersia perrieri TaxID=77586 RepID=A0A0D9WNG5_9ORYZ
MGMQFCTHTRHGYSCHRLPSRTPSNINTQFAEGESAKTPTNPTLPCPSLPRALAAFFAWPPQLRILERKNQSNPHPVLAPPPRGFLAAFLAQFLLFLLQLVGILVEKEEEQRVGGVCVGGCAGEMAAGGTEAIEVRFRLPVGTDIEPSRHDPSTTVAALKEFVLARYPQDKGIVPRTINDVTLINAGRVLENNKTLAESRVPVGEVPGGLITMHVVVRSHQADKNGIIFSHLIVKVIFQIRVLIPGCLK